MLLVIDIGNTNTVAGLYDENRLHDSVRLFSDREDPQSMLIAPLWSWYCQHVADLEIAPQVAVASVVPQLGRALTRFFESNLGVEPLNVSSKVKLPIQLLFDDPTQVGADRIANAVAAKLEYHTSGQPTVVVDFGTATTFDILDAKGDYIGGIICPGPKTAAGNLATAAAQLFDVEIEPPRNGKVIATNTEDAIKVGMFYGTVGEIRFLLDRIALELGAQPQVLATGGLAEVVNQHSGLFETVDPELTLKGIREIYRLNC